MLSASLVELYVCFFFQAEDGIRDRDVTGVQTCALPIFRPPVARSLRGPDQDQARQPAGRRLRATGGQQGPRGVPRGEPRSEERRVGKEWRSRWSPYE